MPTGLWIKVYRFSTAALLLLASSTSSLAGQSHMQTMKNRASQPIGHALFCEQFPQECRVRSVFTRAPKLTRKRWADIVEINNYANTNITPVTDQELYGVEEHWTYPRDSGDCEDYVLLKRYMLLQRGWPESSLLMTVVKQENGDGHAVLTVRTDKADYILDNLEMKVKRWDKTPYLYVKRISERHSGRWTDINDNRRETIAKRRGITRKSKTSKIRLRGTSG